MSPAGRPPIPQPDPHGEHLLTLADGPDGLRRLSARALSLGHLAGEKGAPRFTLPDLADAGGGAGKWWVLTGCRKGSVPAALLDEGPAGARRELHRLIDAFGADRVVVELWDHGDPLDSHRNDALAELAARDGLMVVATNNVHYATPARRPLATALAAVRARRSLDELDPWLPAPRLAHLRSGAEQPAASPATPGAVERAAELGRAAAFDLSLVAPNLPPFPCPDGLTEMQYLRQVVTEHGWAALRRTASAPEGWQVIDHELEVIEGLGFPGYFLVVWDIVEFCRRAEHLLPGAGERGQQRGLLRPRHHQGRCGVARACCSSGSCRPNATARPTSISTSSPIGGKR